MSSRNRGQKTLTAEDMIDADLVNTIAFSADGQEGEANQYLKKDANNKLAFENLVVPDNSIDGDKLTTNIDITTTGDITANEIKTAVISNKTPNQAIVINDTIALGANKDVDLSGTGNISVPVGNILAGAGNIQATNGQIITSIIEHPTPGNTISCRGQLAMNTDKAISLAGTGGITLAGTGNIVVGAGELRITNMNNSAGNGGVINCAGSIALANGKNLSLGGVGAINTGSGSITTGTGDLVSGGAVITDVLDTQTTGQTLTTRCNLQLDTNKNIVLTGSGSVYIPNTGELNTNTISTIGGATLVIGSSVSVVGGGGRTLYVDTIQFDSLSKRNGTGAISVSNDLTLATDKSISLSGTGNITNTSGNIICGAGNIQAGTGEVHTDTIDNSAGNGGNISCKGNLIVSGAKHISTDEVKLFGISHKTPGNTIAVVDNIGLSAGKNISCSTNGTISTDSGNISTISGDLFINAGTGGKVQADEVKCDVISNRNPASNLQIADDLVFANNKSLTTSGTSGTGSFGGNLGTAGNLSASGFLTLGGLSTSDPGVNNQVWVDTNGILRLSGTGSGGGAGVAVSKIDNDSEHYYLQFFSTDGFTCPQPRPALHPNEINDISVAPEIDGFLAMTEGETIIFTGKIPVGWVGTAIKFGLLNDHGGLGTGPFVQSGNTNNCRVSIKNKFLPTASTNTETFSSNTAHNISAPNHLINTIDDMVVIEITDIDSEHFKAYTAGGWIRIEPHPGGGG